MINPKQAILRQGEGLGNAGDGFTTEARRTRRRELVGPESKILVPTLGCAQDGAPGAKMEIGSDRYLRSEEHTSELQSPVHLVCRLLLEKKNINISLSNSI